MSWQVALGLFYITLIAQALLQRSYSQTSKLPLSFPPALSYLLGVTPLGIIVGLTLSHHVHWSWWLLLLLTCEGTFIGLYNWLSFKAIKALPIARFQTVYQSYEIVVIILGYALLGERLSNPQIIGGVLLLIAAFLAIQAPKSKTDTQTKLFNRHAIMLAFFSAGAMGIGLVAEKAALQHMDTGAYFIFGYATQTLALIILASKDIRRKAVKSINRYELKRSFVMGILSACVGFFYIVAIVKSNNVSLITALAAFALPLIVFAGYVFMHERENQRLLWTGMGLGFLGLLISAFH